MFRPLSLLALSVAASLALFAAPASASGTVATFEGGVNLGGWTWGPPGNMPSTGGNPGWWLNAAPDTFAPQLRSSGVHSPYIGDWRAKKVVSLGVDLMTISTQFPASRPLSVVLTGAGGCQVYFVGSSLVPQPGAGWKKFDFLIESQSPLLPAGWGVLNPCGTDDATWNSVIQNVTEVNFFYGDPTFFFIFDIWNVGADNVRLYTDPFTDVGGGLEGINGVPNLFGTGTLAPSSPMTLHLQLAKPLSTTTLIIGLSALNAPFKGGVLVPNPAVVIYNLPVSNLGALNLSGTWPANIPSNTSFWFQHWIVDAVGAAGFSASNGLKGTTP